MSQAVAYFDAFREHPACAQYACPRHLACFVTDLLGCPSSLLETRQRLSFGVLPRRGLQYRPKRLPFRCPPFCGVRRRQRSHGLSLRKYVGVARGSSMLHSPRAPAARSISR